MNADTIPCAKPLQRISQPSPLATIKESLPELFDLLEMEAPRPFSVRDHLLFRQYVRDLLSPPISNISNERSFQ
jgi:hypothetical protein